MWSVIIQAGGLSTRMGRNKALISIGGKAMILKVLERVSDIGDEILIIANQTDLFDFLPVRVVKDILEGYGPLGGLLSGFHYARYPNVLVVACDMPFLNQELLKEQQRILIEGEYDVVVPRTERGFEPLHAAYRKENCVEYVKMAVRNGEKRAISWYREVNVRVVTEQEVKKFDPNLLSFWNVNTVEDLFYAEEIINRS